MQPGGVAVGRQQLFHEGLRAPRLARAAQDDDLALEESDVPGVGRDRFVERLFGLCAALFVVERADQVQPGVQIVTLDGDGLPKPGEPRLDPSLLDQRSAQLAQVLGISWLLAHQASEHRLGLCAVAEVEQHVAQVLLRRRGLGVQLDRRLQRPRRLGVALKFAQQDATGVQQVVVLGKALQGLGGGRLALIEAPGIVELDHEGAVDLRRTSRIFDDRGRQMLDRLIALACAQGRLRSRQPIRHAELSPRVLREDLRPRPVRG